MKTKIFALSLAAFLAAGCGSTTGEKMETDTAATTQTHTQKRVGWYMRTTVEATGPSGKRYMHNTAGVFGELDESKDGLDRHDIEAYGTAVFQVRLINDNLKKGTDYFSDYRAYQGDREKRVWTFQVKNQKDVDLSNADFTLNIEGMYNVYRNGTTGRYYEQRAKDQSLKESLTLVDVDEGRSYSFSDVKRTIFSMNGHHTRTFKWVIGEASQDDFKASKTSRSMRSRALSDFQPRVTSYGKFGLPPE